MAVVHTAGIFTALLPWLGKPYYDNTVIYFLLSGSSGQRPVWWYLNTSMSLCAGGMLPSKVCSVSWDSGFSCDVPGKGQFVNLLNSVPPTKYTWGLKLSKIRLSISTLQQLYIFWNYLGRDGSVLDDMSTPELPAVGWACTDTSKQMEEALVSCSLSKHDVAPWLDKLSCFKVITFSIVYIRDQLW